MTKAFNGIARWVVLLALLVTGVVLAGCSTDKPTSFAEIPGITSASTSSSPTAPPTAAVAPTAAGVAAQPAPPTAGSSELLKPQDTIRIEYNDLPVVTPAFQGPIKEDGTITLILNQSFTAAGKTRGDLEKEIRARYVPKYYKFLTVTVSPVNETRYYYVGGEVRSPGRQMYLSKITVSKAIQSAGDFTDFARKSKVKLTRADGKRVETIDCVKVLQNPNLDVEVYPGDTIHVPRRFW